MVEVAAAKKRLAARSDKSLPRVTDRIDKRGERQPSAYQGYPAVHLKRQKMARRRSTVSLTSPDFARMISSYPIVAIKVILRLRAIMSRTTRVMVIARQSPPFAWVPVVR